MRFGFTDVGFQSVPPVTVRENQSRSQYVSIGSPRPSNKSEMKSPAHKNASVMIERL